MRDPLRRLPFRPADILLPQNCDLTKWSVVACDQYTSQPEYWQRVEEFVGTAPSSLRLILPESCLDGPNVETDIMEVNNTMTRYLREGRFRTCPTPLSMWSARWTTARSAGAWWAWWTWSSTTMSPAPRRHPGHRGHRPLPHPAPGGGAQERPPGAAPRDAPGRRP